MIWGVVVQCINYSPITQEPSIRFHVEAMQRHKWLSKQSIKATLMCIKSGASRFTNHKKKVFVKTIGLPDNLPYKW